MQLHVESSEIKNIAALIRFLSYLYAVVRFVTSAHDFLCLQFIKFFIVPFQFLHYNYCDKNALCLIFHIESMF